MKENTALLNTAKMAKYPSKYGGKFAVRLAKLGHSTCTNNCLFVVGVMGKISSGYEELSLPLLNRKRLGNTDPSYCLSIQKYCLSIQNLSLELRSYHCWHYRSGRTEEQNISELVPVQEAAGTEMI